MNNSFTPVHSELVRKWSNRNLSLAPDKITYGSNKKAIWKCKLRHEWKASIKSRTIDNTVCPYSLHNKVLE